MVSLMATENPTPPVPLWQLADEDVSRRLSCYGISFATTEPDCMARCEVRDRCVSRIASHLFPQLETEQKGSTKSLPILASVLQIDEETARVLLAVAAGQKVEDLLPESLGVEATKAAEAAAKKVGTPKPSIPSPPPKAAKVKKAPPSKGAGSSELKAIAAVAKKQSGGVPESELKVEAPTSVPDVVEISESPALTVSAPSVTSPVMEGKKAAPAVAKGKVKKAPARKPAAATVKAVNPLNKKKRKVSVHTAAAGVVASNTAFERERLKSPFVAGLKDGQVLAREFDGTAHSLTVDHAHRRYVLDGKDEFATVYAATASIVGLVERPKQRPAGKKRGKVEGTRSTSNWSARRFWGAPAKVGKQKTAGAKKSVAKGKKAK